MEKAAVSGDFQKLIDSIVKADGTFRRILSVDPDQLVISYDERAQIEKLIGRDERLLAKLRSQEFEIAIVGLEKAGKSTLSNALIRVNVLPAESERCTYTKTEIRSGKEDRAEVEFYSPEEFSSNFDSQLRQIGYKPCSLSDFSSSDFESFCKDLSEKDPAKYSLYGSSTIPDIRAMSENRRDILPFLGRETLTFTGKDQLKSTEFRKFITGFRQDNTDSQSLRGGFPYAVKSIRIESRDLGDDMKTAVLLDVPGFDSPTQLHREQTEETLRSADAIIFVSNVGDKPNLNDSQISMLRKSDVDDDGIRLRDKAFVFGNKLDMANNEADASKNKDVLRTEVTDKYQIARPGRVIFGSAEAYLIREGLDDSEWSDSILSNIDLYNGGRTGVEDLKSALKEYYAADRLHVMERRAANTRAKISELLKGILEKCRSADESPVSAAGQLFVEIKDAIETFCSEVWDVGNDFKKEIVAERPFTGKLREQIGESAGSGTADSSCFYHVTDREFLAAQRSQNSSVSANVTDSYVQKIDSELRDMVRTRLSHDAELLAVDEIKKESDELHRRIVQKLVSCLTVKDDAKADAEKAADEFIRNFDSGRDFRFEFRALIERFSGKLIDGIINRPFGSEERIKFIINNIPEFCMLANYYNFSVTKDADQYVSPMESRFFPLIIAHISGASGDAGELVGKFMTDPAVIKDVSKYGWQDDLSPEKKDQYVNMLKGIPYDRAKVIMAKLKDSVRAAASRGQSISISQMLTELLVDEKKSGAASGQGSGNSFGDYLRRLSAEAKAPSTEEEVRALIDADIDSLKEVFDKSIAGAIDLETAFINFNSRTIDFIRESAKPKDRRVISWINANIGKLRRKELEEAEAKARAAGTRKVIREEIEDIMKGAE